MKTVKKVILGLIIFTMIFLCATLSAFSADSQELFEKSISGFPESYKPYLRELHNAYPNWEFVPFQTGLDWSRVIDNEHTDNALVYDSITDKILKSHDPDDYDRKNDEYIYKDGGFVAASRNAVEYFMDPRNFLDKGGIFQFELLSFSELYTVAAVENVLSGSFMGKKNITYYDASGKLITTQTTYAQAIFNAGKTYNINPCFLASKILNEVGSNGSDSVSGKVPGYLGIYNFYNIGATDGDGAIERGLLWAKGGTANSTYYGRPWNTPEKSILGGAQFLAEEYIAAGQFTGYLQRFNVNTAGSYPIYTHQYMSNLSGAVSQGYSTYKSYRDLGMLNSKIVFSIPVYLNMSDPAGNGKLTSVEATDQYGKVTENYCNVRLGPSIDHDKLCDSYGNNIQLSSGTEVKILAKYDTDAYYYEEILSDPYWYEVNFNYNGRNYTGFLPACFVEIQTMSHVPLGKMDLSLFASDGINYRLGTVDTDIVKIIDSDTVEFLKSGIAEVFVYDSYGHFEIIKFKVGNNYAAHVPMDFTVVSSANAIKVTVKENDAAQGYGFYLGDEYGNYITGGVIKNNSYIFSNLKKNTLYKVYARNYYRKNVYGRSDMKQVYTKENFTPEDVTGISAQMSETAIRLSWEPSFTADGYRVYRKKGNEFEKCATVAETQATVYNLTPGEKYIFAVRAYKIVDGEVIWCKGYDEFETATKPTAPKKAVGKQNESKITLAWSKSYGADGYRIYYLKSNSWKACATVNQTTHSFSGLKSGSKYTFAIRPYIITKSGVVWGNYITHVSSTVPATPLVKTASLNKNQITVKWYDVYGADGYALYYKAGNGNFKLYGKTAAAKTLTFKNLKSGTKYTFAVRAYIKTDDGYVLSSYNPVSAIVK
ncbi:MAG: fibronectin type III domain-containing protein [Acutalibacteraceae bacterium]